MATLKAGAAILVNHSASLIENTGLINTSNMAAVIIMTALNQC